MRRSGSPARGCLRGGLTSACGGLAPRQSRLRRPFGRLNLALRFLGPSGLAGGGFAARGSLLGTPCGLVGACGGLAVPNRPERRVGQRPANGRRHVGDRGHAIDRPQRPLAPIVIHKRRGLGLVGRESLLQHLGIIVRAERLAARPHLVNPRSDPADQDVRVDLQRHHAIEPESLLVEHAVE